MNCSIKVTKKNFSSRTKSRYFYNTTTIFFASEQPSKKLRDSHKALPDKPDFSSPNTRADIRFAYVIPDESKISKYQKPEQNDHFRKQKRISQSTPQCRKCCQH